MGDKCEGQVGDKCRLMRPKAPRVGDKCGRQVEDKCKLMRPKAPKCEGQVGATQDTQSARQAWKTSVGDKCKLMQPKAPRVGDKWETSVNSCGPRHPE